MRTYKEKINQDNELSNLRFQRKVLVNGYIDIQKEIALSQCLSENSMQSKYSLKVQLMEDIKEVESDILHTIKLKEL